MKFQTSWLSLNLCCSPGKNCRLMQRKKPFISKLNFGVWKYKRKSCGRVHRDCSDLEPSWELQREMIAGEYSRLRTQALGTQGCGWHKTYHEYTLPGDWLASLRESLRCKTLEGEVFHLACLWSWVKGRSAYFLSPLPSSSCLEMATRRLGEGLRRWATGPVKPWHSCIAAQ